MHVHCSVSSALGILLCQCTGWEAALHPSTLWVCACAEPGSKQADSFLTAHTTLQNPRAYIGSRTASALELGNAGRSALPS